MFDYHFPAYLLHWYDCLMHLPTFTVKCSWQSQNIAKFHLAERWPNKSPLARLSFRSIFWLLSEKPIWFNITDKMLTIYHNLVLWWTACDGINFVAFTNRSTAKREKSKRRMEIFITNAYYAFSDCHECTGKRYRKADWMGWPSFMQRGKWWINVKWIFERSPPSMHTPHIRPCQQTCVCLPNIRFPYPNSICLFYKLTVILIKLNFDSGFGWFSGKIAAHAVTCSLSTPTAYIHKVQMENILQLDSEHGQRMISNRYIASWLHLLAVQDTEDGSSIKSHTFRHKSSRKLFLEVHKTDTNWEREGYGERRMKLQFIQNSKLKNLLIKLLFARSSKKRNSVASCKASTWRLVIHPFAWWTGAWNSVATMLGHSPSPRSAKVPS